MKKYFYQLATDQRNGFWAACQKGILFVLSFFYGLGVLSILWLYRVRILKAQKLSRPVISIGNITLGGVGKTPLTEFLASFFETKNVKPAILLRGFMPENPKKGGLPIVSDEAILLKESLPSVPVAVGGNRFKMGQEILSHVPVDIFLLDDGFQHWRLARDIDVVAIDALNPFGNGHLIPRGILREPKQSLSRANIIVITKADLGKDNLADIERQLKQINPRAIMAKAIHAPVSLDSVYQKEIARELSFLKGKSICSFCSIGDPDSFTESLKNLGANIKKHFSFMDHHVYTSEEIAKIAEACKRDAIQFVVTTHKDAVKLKSYEKLFNGLTLLSLKIKIEIIEGQNEIFSRLSALHIR